VSQNTRGIIPKESDPNLKVGIENIVKLQAGIASLKKNNAEWNQYPFKEHYEKSYCNHITESRHSFSSSSEMAEGTYFKMGETSITSLYIWTHQLHKSGQDATGAGSWSWFTVLGKHNAKMIYISCYVNTSGKAGVQIPHLPLGDDSSPLGGIMQYVGKLTRFTRMCVTSHSQPLINKKYKIPSNKLLVNNN
jgi:hypothetical protein